ncbi:MAG: hypothetical protein NTW08_10360 [Gammaproteobacteria bacterium]|nr:hypothetical protein [Gammaproteobacteria bacterium]
MTEDRYEVNHTLYVVGLMSLLGSLSLIFFALYILPSLLWDLAYTVPDAVKTWHVWLQEERDWSASGSGWLMFSVFMVPGLILGYISYWASNRLDEGLPDLVPTHIELAVSDEEQEVQEIKKEQAALVPWRLAGWLLLACVCIVLAVGLVHKWISL